jgi:hypothetical protein
MVEIAADKTLSMLGENPPSCGGVPPNDLVGFVILNTTQNRTFHRNPLPILDFRTFVVGHRDLAHALR